MCIGKFARRTWVNFTQQYGKIRQRCQQNIFYYGVWQVLLYYFLITYGVCKKRKYCNRMSEKKNSLLLTNVHDLYVLEDETSQKKFPSVCLSGRLSVCLDVWLYVRTWTFHVDTITFEGVSGSKKNLVGVFYVWNVGLVLQSKVKSWSWSKSWSWTEFWFSQKLCGATPNFVDNFSIWRITCSNEFHSEILILVFIENFPQKFSPCSYSKILLFEILTLTPANLAILII